MYRSAHQEGNDLWCDCPSRLLHHGVIWYAVPAHNAGLPPPENLSKMLYVAKVVAALRAGEAGLLSRAGFGHHMMARNLQNGLERSTFVD